MTSAQTASTRSADDQHDFTHVTLPRIDKQVLRLGVATNYGLDADDVRWAADQGVGYWLWTSRSGGLRDGLAPLLARERERHVVAGLGLGLWGGQVRRGVESALRKLKTDYLDVYKLSWLGRASRYSRGVIDTALELKREGKIRALGISIHDRKRAGKLAVDSEIDVFMIRYNAKHPGAEQDIFPHLSARQPAVISYTATAWRQLLREVRGVDEPPLSAAQCYRFCLSSPHVHVALTGPKTRDELAQNLAALAQGPLDDDEMVRVRAYGARIKSKRKLDYL